jgi:hypothetical protein
MHQHHKQKQTILKSVRLHHENIFLSIFLCGGTPHIYT